MNNSCGWLRRGNQPPARAAACRAAGWSAGLLRPGTSRTSWRSRRRATARKPCAASCESGVRLWNAQTHMGRTFFQRDCGKPSTVNPFGSAPRFFCQDSARFIAVEVLTRLEFRIAEAEVLISTIMLSWLSRTSAGKRWRKRRFARSRPPQPAPPASGRTIEKPYTGKHPTKHGSPRSGLTTLGSSCPASRRVSRPRRWRPQSGVSRWRTMFFSNLKYILTLTLTFILTFGYFLANFERLVLGCIEAEFCK